MFGLVLTLVLVGIWIYVIMDIISTPAEEVRFLPKLVWLFFAVFFMAAAVVLWLLVGRPRRVPADGGPEARDEPHAAPSSRGPAARDGDDPRPAELDTPGRWVRTRRNGGRPIAPDDDPEFLRELSDRIRRGQADDPPRA